MPATSFGAIDQSANDSLRAFSADRHSPRRESTSAEASRRHDDQQPRSREDVGRSESTHDAHQVDRSADTSDSDFDNHLDQHGDQAGASNDAQAPATDAQQPADDQADPLAKTLLATLQPLLMPNQSADPEAVLRELGVVDTDGEDGTNQAMAMLGLGLAEDGDAAADLTALAQHQAAGAEAATLTATATTQTTATSGNDGLTAMHGPQHQRVGADQGTNSSGQTLQTLGTSTGVDQQVQMATAETDGDADAGLNDRQRQAVPGMAAMVNATTDGSDDGALALPPGMRVVSATPAANAVASSAVQASSELAEPTPADRALADQVGRALVRTLSDGQRSLTLRLTPPELGTVRIEIVEQAGRMSVRLGAEDDSVRAALERALPNLRNELRGGDAPIDDVRLTDNQMADQQREQQKRQARDRQARRDGTGFSLDGEFGDQADLSTEREAPQLTATVSETAVDARA